MRIPWVEYRRLQIFILNSKRRKMFEKLIQFRTEQFNSMEKIVCQKKYLL